MHLKIRSRILPSFMGHLRRSVSPKPSTILEITSVTTFLAEKKVFEQPGEDSVLRTFLPGFFESDDFCVPPILAGNYARRVEL